MPRQVEPSLSWEDAPDTITPTHLGKILGLSLRRANEIFNSKDFPKLPEKRGAYKYEVAKFMGISISGAPAPTDTERILETLNKILEVLSQRTIYREGVL